MGVNCDTEIYYHLNYSKHECYFKINQYYKEKKNFRFRARVNAHHVKNNTKHGSVDLWECNNNNNEEKTKNKIVIS